MVHICGIDGPRRHGDRRWFCSHISQRESEGKTGVVATLLGVAAAIVLFLGGWLFLILYWLVAWALRAVRRVEAK